MSGLTTATVIAGISAAAGVGGTIASAVGGGSSRSSSAPTPAPTPAPPKADDTNTAAATTQEAQLGPGRAANIAAGDDNSGSLDATADDQYSVKKKLLGD